MRERPHSPETCIFDELVIEARSDRDAFGRLYDEIYPPVFRYCLRRTGNRSLAEDTTSTVFVSVAKEMADFRGESYLDFRRWVFSIATNVMNAHYRQNTRRESLLLQAAESGQLHQATGDNGQATTLEKDTLQAALMRLAERDRSIITLRYFSGASYDDIGHILKISSNAARTAASRAVEKMKKDIERS